MFNNFFNKFRKTEEVKEEDKRLNENDLKGYLRKFVPSNEISSGDEWETYGEGLDNNEKEEEKEDELIPVLTSDSNEEEMDQAYKNFNDSLKEEEPEESITIEAGVTEDELKQKIWDQLIVGNDKNKELSENPKMDADIEHKQKKISLSPRKEKEILTRSMNPLYKVSRKKQKPPSSKDNLKTISDKKRERMAREKIAKILDSQQG